MQVNKRGSIPVTVLVIMTIALFTFALITFSINKERILNKIGNAASLVEELNLKVKAKEYSGQDFKEPIVESSKKYWFFGEPRIEISVRKTD